MSVCRLSPEMTDAQWALLCPEARSVMAELRRGPGGRPREHDLRAVVKAIGYVSRDGIEWRALPVDLPAVGGGVCLRRALERPRTASRAARAASGTAAGGVRAR
jgi:transposase